MKRHFLSVCAALFALTVLCSVTAYAADNVCAILYDDGTMVFQNGDTPDGRAVTKTYEVDLNALYTGYQSDYAPWYDERESVRVVNFADKISPKATAWWFYACSNLERVDNIQNLDTVNVMDMSYMFRGCSGLTVLDVSHFDTAKVTNMSNMFYGCSGLTALDLSKFNTANVTNMWQMFYNCGGLTALDVSHFDTANVTITAAMFYGCSALTALDVSQFDTANVMQMFSMFSGCGGLTALDLSNFDTAKVTDMDKMFYGCSNLKTIYTSDKFLTISIPETKDHNSYNMFNNCTSLVGGNGTKFDSNHTDKAYARIDTPSAPGYFTDIWDVVKSHIITAYVGEGGTVTPAGDCRVRAGDNQKYVMTPNPGYRVQSVRIDGVEIGALSEYVFQNVIRDHNIVVSFERLPQYAITAAAKSNGQLSVTLTNTAPVTVAVSYFNTSGKFLSADMKAVPANAGSVELKLLNVNRARVSMFDDQYRPLCDPYVSILGA